MDTRELMARVEAAETENTKLKRELHELRTVQRQLELRDQQIADLLEAEADREDGDSEEVEKLKDEVSQLKGNLRDLRYAYGELQTLQAKTRNEVDEKVSLLEKYTRDPNARSERERDLLLKLGQQQSELHDAQAKMRGMTNQLEAYNRLPSAQRKALSERSAQLAAIGSDVERAESDYYRRMLAESTTTKKRETRAERMATQVAKLADELLTPSDHDEDE